MELRATESGGIGLFPEQLLNVEWLGREIRDRSAVAGGPRRADPDGGGPSVLNLFAHTGLLTLSAARAGATVTHVDAARGAAAWARQNAKLSGLADRPIRWIVDDAVGFVGREARRGRRYDGILLDPPTYGHSGRRAWRIEVDLPMLLEACAAVAPAEPFVLLTAHTTGFDDDWLARALARAFPAATGRITTEPLEVEAESGAVLRLGTGVRASR
jgi:23S rRNA (cytosine1962-C5)-methyltransferase